MQTHRDSDAQNSTLRELFAEGSNEMERLKERAGEMVAKGESQITAGKPGEAPLIETVIRGVHVRQLPDDEQGITRVSVGGVTGEFVYCTFRGKVGSSRAMLLAALRALEKV